ncbi:ABC transporter ATP-binding protein [Salisediminibacterium halotolerans]|uniref:Carnitine transport ATP-binding protein OpuCA n=1 Tax=Salisediminibacterium halotolerans TaxID=517425 RepID=A0A1H9VKQ2_9BACI|nr:iron(III) transport system ATP-binding protein [Salisediminibacterium haloalkalitolerans]
MDIALHGIEKSFGKLQALKPIDLHINNGDFVCLLGPSGCGKTTLLRIIGGLENADEGRIQFSDRLIFDQAKKINVQPQKRKIGMVFQDFALWPHMTVFENVAYGLRAQGRKAEVKDKVSEALANVQLGEHAKRYPHQLSGGQQQRVAIARAIANDPEIILMDEPLSALDATLRDEMRILLQSLVKKLGMTAIYVTHDQHEAMTMADQIVVMNDGNIMQQGSPEDVYREPENETVARFVGKGAVLEGMHRQADGIDYLQLNHQTRLPLPQKEHVDFADGTMLTVVIRPEQINLTKAPAETLLAGTVKTVSFLGEKYEVSFTVDGSDELLFANAKERMAPGDQVYFNIDTKSIHIIEKDGMNYVETA